MHPTCRLNARSGARRSCTALTLFAVCAASGCVETQQGSDSDGDARQDPQLVFWEALGGLCGQAFEGRVMESVPPDPSFEGHALVMHVRSCEPGEIRIPVHVGGDRSRTWVVTTTAVGLRLNHEHRREDGSDDPPTRYGGDARGRGEATVQSFPVDAYSTGLEPETIGNVWTLELHPGRTFVYALGNEETDRAFRVEFDLTRSVEPPPPPWGG
jgi:hypothetical protein